jgi:hypothetical protein
MTVKELIDHLGKFDPQTKVMFSHTDTTDWTVKLDIKKKNVKLGDILSDDEDDDVEDLFDDNDKYIGPKVVLFDLGY